MKVHFPDTLARAVKILDENGEDVRVLSGGTAFMILQQAGLLLPEHVVSLRHIDELRRITVSPHGLEIGAMATLREVQFSPIVREHHRVLAETIALVANIRIRNVATIGGNIAEADPSSDAPVILTALGATVICESASGAREEPIESFYRDFFETSCDPTEIVTAVRVPFQESDHLVHYCKYVSRSADDRTCVSVAASLRVDDDGRCLDMRIALGGSGPVPVRSPEADAAIVGTACDSQALTDLANAYSRAADPISDSRGSADYRRKVIASLVPRAVMQAMSNSKGATLL